MGIVRASDDSCNNATERQVRRAAHRGEARYAHQHVAVRSEHRGQDALGRTIRSRHDVIAAQRDQCRVADLHDELLALRESEAVIHVEQDVLLLPCLVGRQQIGCRKRRAAADGQQCAVRTLGSGIESSSLSGAVRLVRRSSLMLSWSRLTAKEHPV